MLGMGKATTTPAPNRGAPSDRPDSGSADLAALKAEARSSARRATKQLTKVDEQAAQAELEALFESENWEEISSLYFDARFAMTGWEGFRLSDKQKAVLGSTMGSAMRVLLKIDPRYIAAFVFCANFGAIIADKEVRWYQEAKTRRAAS